MGENVDSKDNKALENCSMEIRELKKDIDKLLKQNAELEQKVNEIYGAYETFQYACAGQCNNLLSKIETLRNYVTKLEEELNK